MPRNQIRTPPRGFTLLEMIVSMAITVVVIAMVTQALVALDRDQAYRSKIALMQGGARQTLDLMEGDLRHAGLGVGSQAAIWMASNGASVSRPAIQIFANLGGPGGAVVADAKANTDALLVVEAIDSTSQAVTMQAMSAANWAGLGGVVSVNNSTGFSIGDAVLMSNSAQASWGILAADPSGTPGSLTLTSLVDVLPPAIGTRQGQPTVQLGNGSPVRRARARLYYVNSNDELVRLTLLAPRAPAAGEVLGAAVVTAASPLGKDVLAWGVDNMKIDCGTAGVGLAFSACAASSVSACDPALQAEAVASFGAFAAGGGPLFSTLQNSGCVNPSTVQTINVGVAFRNYCQTNPACTVDPNQSDPPVPLTGALGATTLPAVDGRDHSRRAYSINVALRNNTLGVL